MDKILQFKTERIKTEFPTIDNRLRVILFALSEFVDYTFNKTIMLTELWRTKAEQLAIYPDKPQMTSVHQEGRGADIRVIGWFTDDECNKILKFLNATFEYNNQYQTALRHNVGQGDHIHIQVSWNPFTNINRIRDIQ
jgi:hypothetical protein